MLCRKRARTTLRCEWSKQRFGLPCFGLFGGGTWRDWFTGRQTYRSIAADRQLLSAVSACLRSCSSFPPFPAWRDRKMIRLGRRGVVVVVVGKRIETMIQKKRTVTEFGSVCGEKKRNEKQTESGPCPCVVGPEQRNSNASSIVS